MLSIRLIRTCYFSDFIDVAPSSLSGGGQPRRMSRQRGADWSAPRVARADAASNFSLSRSFFEELLDPRWISSHFQ